MSINKKVEIFRNIDLHVVEKADGNYQVWIRNQRQPEKDKLVLKKTTHAVVIAVAQTIKDFKKGLHERLNSQNPSKSVITKYLKKLIKAIKSRGK